MTRGATASNLQAGAGMQGGLVAREVLMASPRRVAEDGRKATLAGRRCVYSGPLTTLAGASQRLLPLNVSAFLTGRLLARRR